METRSLDNLPGSLPSLLLIDDEERIVRSLAMLFRGRCKVFVCTDPHEALRILDREQVHVVISDQRMPLMSGAELLRQVRERAPNAMRILLTGYSELDAVVASVNAGEIFRFVQKPWDAQTLRSMVDQAAAISRALYAAGAHAPPPATLAPVPERILVLGRDQAIYQVVRELLEGEHPVDWAQSTDEALQQIAAQSIGVLIAELDDGDPQVPALLKVLKAQHPELVSIVLTPLQDVGTFIGLINQGQVYRLLPKPIRRGSLSMGVANAIRHHRALRQAPSLREAHSVESIQPPEERSIAQRVMSQLQRLRLRTVG